MLKRIFDILFSLISSIILFPIILTFWLLAALDTTSNGLFFQQRIGQYAKPFTIYKLRTLHTKTTHISKFGMFFRRYKLDELPQLFNVLKGDMSVVGPRPLLPEYLPLYNTEQKQRHSVKPGITGWAQVNGRNAISWEQKFEYDVWYVENESFWLDAKIFLITFGKVFKPKDISQQGQATMEKFKG